MTTYFSSKFTKYSIHDLDWGRLNKLEEVLFNSNFVLLSILNTEGFNIRF